MIIYQYWYVCDFSLTPEDMVQQLESQNWQLGLLIDLTNTDRYYRKGVRLLCQHFFLNPYVAGGCLYQCKIMQKKIEKWPKSWQLGTHLRVLGEIYHLNTNLSGIRFLSPFALDESSLSIGCVNVVLEGRRKYIYEWGLIHHMLLQARL